MTDREAFTFLSAELNNTQWCSKIISDPDDQVHAIMFESALAIGLRALKERIGKSEGCGCCRNGEYRYASFCPYCGRALKGADND